MKGELSVIGILLVIAAACIGTFVGFNVPLYFVEFVIMYFIFDLGIKPEHQDLLAIDLILFISMTAIVVGLTFGIVANKLLSKTKSQKEVLEVLNGGDVEKVRKELLILRSVLLQLVAYIGAFVIFGIPFIVMGIIKTPLQFFLVLFLPIISGTISIILAIIIIKSSSKTKPKK
jgi:hypothetical protein